MDTSHIAQVLDDLTPLMAAIVAFVVAAWLVHRHNRRADKDGCTPKKRVFLFSDSFKTNEHGEQTTWSLQDLPITVYHCEGMSSRARFTLYKAIAKFNDASPLVSGGLQVPFYTIAKQVELEDWMNMLQAWNDGQRHLRSLMVSIINSDYDTGGYTDMISLPSGDLVQGFSRVNEANCSDIRVWLHELGHGLGLDDDGTHIGVMHPNIDYRPRLVTGIDCKKLHSGYSVRQRERTR